MTIGPDIEEALDEVGTAVTITGSDSVVHTGEYIYYKPNSQATKPFIREFFLEAWFPYNTAAVSGDLIGFTVPGTKYMLMNLTPFMFENSIIRKDGVLYKCNVEAVLLRPREVRDAVSYLTRTVWDVVSSSMWCLVTTPLYGNELDTDEQVGQLGLEVHELYARDIFGIQVYDRIKVSSDQYYRVESIKYRRYDGVTVYELGEDTRAYTTTTTTTTSTTTTTTTTTVTGSYTSTTTTTSTTSSTTTSSSTTSSSTTSSSTTSSSTTSSSTTTTTSGLTEITETVSANGDDGHTNSSGVFNAGANESYFGCEGAVTYRGFFRFSSVSIPAGKTIVSAKIQMRCRGTLSGITVNVKAHCEAADSPTAPSSHSDLVGRPLTTGTAWNNVGSWTNASLYDSVDFVNDLQEVVDRLGWAENNAVTVHIVDNGSSGAAAYRNPGTLEYSGVYAAKLVVTYM